MQDLVEFSRARIEKGSKSFALAARLFPADTRESAYMLYAWCRHCDDLVDDQVLGHDRSHDTPSRDAARDIVERLEQQTRAALAGQPSEPAFEALREVARRHEIPEAYPLELIAGFRMDADGRAYETIEDVLEYCYHVAGVVGVMMAMVMGVRDPAVLRRASDLGIAFQLTNIARDVVPDHAAGRVYLPRQWLDEAGLARDEMAAPANRGRLFAVVARLLDQAEPYYASSRVGMAHLPFRAAWAVGAASAVYRDIGTLVRQRGAEAWDRRASTSPTRKLAGVTAGLSAAINRRTRADGIDTPSREGLWTPSSLRAE